MKGTRKIAGAALAVAAIVMPIGAAAGVELGPGRGLHTLPGDLPGPAARQPGVLYDLDLREERFFILIPPNYTPARPFGLLVFLSPADAYEVPSDWESTLRQRSLIYIAPQRVGNRQPTARRRGMAVAAALAMIDRLNIDPDRVFLAGFSGGARIASQTAFLHPEIFTGVIAIGGAEFFERVERRHATEEGDYGYFELPDGLAERAKHRVRYALVTGSQDFRRGNLMDLHEGGFRRHGIEATLIDVRGMGHVICPDRFFRQALDFVDRPPRMPAPPSPAHLPEPGPLRTWTSVTGATVEARLLRIVGSQAHLALADGALVRIEITRLSEPDRAHLHQHLGR